MIKQDLHNYQFDYIKIKAVADQTKKLKWDNLVEHPNIKNNYCLNNELGQFVKNFKLYHRRDDGVFIELSIPYFLEGHNYLATSPSRIREFKNQLELLLGIDLALCKISAYEFGAFETIGTESKDYIKSILGLSNMDLEKSNPTMKMYGDSSQAIHYKIYDAVANAKKKKTFTRGNFPKSGLIKHELKITNTNRFHNKEVVLSNFLEEKFHEQNRALLCGYYDRIVFKEEILFKPLKNDLTNILFTCLKSVEHKLEKTIPNLLDQIIGAANLTASQRSKRKKAIQKLDKIYSQSVKR